MGSTRGSRETERAAVTRNSRIVGPLVCLAILGERKYPVLKSSFAYCASRRRVFGSANNGGLPLSTSLFLLSLSLSLRVLFHSLVFAAHTCARSRACLQEHYSRATISRSARARAKPEGSDDSRRESRSIILDHARRASPLIPPITQGVPSVIHAISIHLDTVARHRAPPLPRRSYARVCHRIRLFTTRAYERTEREERRTSLLILWGANKYSARK